MANAVLAPEARYKMNERSRDCQYLLLAPRVPSPQEFLSF